MKKVILLFIFPLLFLGKSFGQCTAVNCAASLPPIGGMCNNVFPDGVVNQSYNNSESFVVTDNCFDAGLVDPDFSGNLVKVTNADNFTFASLPSGVFGFTNAFSYSPPNGGSLAGCAAIIGTPTQAGVFGVSLNYFADVLVCGSLLPLNDYPTNFPLSLTILPDASFSGLAPTYNIEDSNVPLSITGTQGGVFYGPGVSGTTFSPAVAGVGTHIITYIVSAQQGTAIAAATNSSSITVTVEDVVVGPSAVYVDQSASGANDGTSWANAFTNLEDALIDDGSNVARDILIAAGTYKPGTTRSSSFSIETDANLIGGYPNGGGTNPDPNTYSTILSGDVDGDGALSGNSYHVVKALNGAEVTLTNLTISGGNANGNILTQFGRSRGGGIFVSGASCSIDNCIVTGNFAGLGGGLFATLSPNTSIENSKINNNEAERGAALYHSNETNMYIIKSRITNNNSTNRCAVEINNSLFTRIENSVIANNASGNANAIALIATNRNQTCEIINSTILGETKNKALFSMQIGFGDVLDVDVSNSIIAHQTNSFNKNIVVFNNGILNFNVSNSYFAGSGLTNLNGGGTYNVAEVATMYAAVAGDLLLSGYAPSNCSPTVNTGDNNFVSLLSDFNQGPTDINGNPRIALSTVDMGAHEKEFACPSAKENIAQPISSSISIYPNPVNDIVNIQTDLEDFTVQIHDILGRLLVHVSNKTAININTLSKGTYIMNIFQDGELKGTEKLVKH